MRRLAPALALLALGLGACAKRPALEAETKPRLAKSDSGLSAETVSPSGTMTAKASPEGSDSSSSSAWGDEFFKKGDYRRAIAYLSEAVKKNQGSAKLWRNLGSAYALAQDYDNAILCYQRALKRNPHDIKTHYNLSLIHNFKGTPEELKMAEVSAKEGLKEDPNHGPLHSSLGNIYADESKDDEALKEYQRALEINPKDPITRFNKGALHFKRREIKEAENEYYQTLKIDPKDAEAAQNLAAIYILQDRLEEAERDRQNKLEQGLNMYKLALQVAPWDAAAYVNTAVILERMNRKKEALTYWEKYQRLFPASRRAAEISSRIEILKKMVKSEKKVKVEE
jgi:tetratricopeptide (TPR) repeat protein